MSTKDIFFNRAINLERLAMSVFILFITSMVSAQITSGTINPEEENKEKDRQKKDSEFVEDSLSGTNFYMSGLFQYSYRSFEDQSPTQTYYQEWERQTSAYNGGFNLGILMELNHFFHLDIGLTYFGHSENYAFQDSLTDSTFAYKNTYTQIGIPMRARFVYGDKFQVFGFLGICPINILKIKYESNYKTEEGVTVERDDLNLTDGFSTFNLMLSGGFGMTYNLKHLAFFIAPEYRRHLLNTYADKVISMDHKMFSYSVSAGIVLKF